MQKSVLVEIVRSLSRKEMRDIQKWLQSPAHNQRQDVVQLFDYLGKSLANGDESLAKERAWAAIFPGQPYDDAFMRQVMYFLLKSVEECLVFINLSADRAQYQLVLTRIYRERNLEKASKYSHRIGKESLESQPLRDSNYLRNLFFLEQEYSRWANIVTNASANLQETSDALEKWFLAEKLHNAYAMLAHQTVYKTVHYQQGLLQAVLSYIKEKNWLDEPAIAIYYYAYLAVMYPVDESYFDRLEYLIHNKAERFTHSEFRTPYLAALNYCVPKINQGRLDFARRAFDLYRKGLETGILLENNTVSRYTFGNAVGAALKIQEFDWAEKFIEDFQHHLEERERNSVVNFNLSRIYFEKGEYDKAQHLLTQFEYDELHWNIIAKTMLLKIYYEQDEYDAFESLLESLRIYLQRKEALDPARKASFKNLISLMKKLLHLNIYSKPHREKFRELVMQTNPLAEREWLLKQLERR